MRSRKTRHLPNLVRALYAALDCHTQFEVAEAIGSLGEREAYDQLARAVVRGGPRGEVCAAVLHNHAPSSTPSVLSALFNTPDRVGLVHALPEDADDACVTALAQVCRRTTNPFVVRAATELCARAGDDQLRKVAEAAEKRASELMQTAVTVGRIACDPHGQLDRVTPLFSGDVDTQMLALSVPEALVTAEAQQCLRQLLRTGRVAHRHYAFKIIAAHRLHSMIPDAIERYLNERSPSVRMMALGALRANSTAVGPVLADMMPTAAEELEATVARVLQHVIQPSDADPEEVAGTVEKTLEKTSKLWRLAQVDDTACVEAAVCLGPVLLSAASMLAWFAQADRLPRTLLPTVEEALRCALGMCRQAWQAGSSGARETIFTFSGLPVFTEASTARGKCMLPQERLDDATVLNLLHQWAVTTVNRWFENQGDTPSERAPSQHPLSAMVMMSVQGQSLVQLFCTVCGKRTEKRAVAELASSLDREQVATARALQIMDHETLKAFQDELNHTPLFNLSIIDRSVADFFVVERAHREPGKHAEATAAFCQIMVEQMLQLLLLEIIRTGPTVRSTQTLLRCVGSHNALVSELASTALVEIGPPILSPIATAIEGTNDDDYAAHLLEVCRCIDTARAAALARRLTGREGRLIQAACVQALGSGGDADDCSTVCQLMQTDDALMMVSALQVLAKLSPDLHVDVFAEFMGSRYPGIWWAGISGLVRCSPSVRDEALQRLQERGTPLQKLAARVVSSPDALADWTEARICGFDAPGGDYCLGSRLVVKGPRPWQWGIPWLLGDLAHVPTERLELLTCDDELASQWMESAWTGQYAPRLIPRLLELSKGADCDTEARMMLFELLIPSLQRQCACLFAYHGVSDPIRFDKLWKAFCRTIETTSVRDAETLVAPNPSGSNPLGDQGTPASWSATLPYVIGQRTMANLARLLGVTRPTALDDPEPVQRSNAILREWRRAMQYQDILYGFWVQPCFTFNDIAWFVRTAEGHKQVKREMIDYLLAAVTIRPVEEHLRQQAFAAILEVFTPLRRKTTRQLALMYQSRKIDYEQEAWDEAAGVVDAEFGAALGEFDAFWAQEPAAFLPLGTLERMSADRSAAPVSPAVQGVPTRYMPFNLFIRKRLQGSVPNESKSNWGAVIKFWPEPKDDDSPPSPLEAAGTIEVRAPEGPHDILTYLAEDGARAIPGKVTLSVDGKSSEYIDIETLASVLDVVPQAIRNRAKRNQLTLTKVHARNYLDLQQLPEVVWLCTSDVCWAEILGVSRNTVARWKKSMPKDLTPQQRGQYLFECRDRAKRSKS